MPYVFDITWEVAGDKQLIRRLRGLETRTIDARPAFEEVLGIIEDEVRYQYRAQGEPKWAELSKSYAARKLAQWGSQPIMVASARLYRSETERHAVGAISGVGPDYATRGTSIRVGKRRQWNLGLVHQKPRARKRPTRAQMLLRGSAQTKIVLTIRQYIFTGGEARSTYVSH
jgi:phage gpG-like protein